MSDVDPLLIARGVATAVAADGQLDATQASLLCEVTAGLYDLQCDYMKLEPLSADELAQALAAQPESFRRRIAHLMVLGELILHPIPLSVARAVTAYAKALDVNDQFVRIAHRYAQGGFGLAWLDLQQSGFVEHWEMARKDQLKSTVLLEDQLAGGVEDSALAELWMSYQDAAPGTLGRSVWEMYRGRGFALPGSVGGASAYLAQHDFVHVLADYGTNLNGEFEVFGLIGRADPDPKGFAWIATLIGLFETGYVENAGFFVVDVNERHLESTDMHIRIGDALRRGRLLCDRLGTDLLDVDYHEYANATVTEAQSALGFEPKSERAIRAGSPGVFDRDGMSLNQRRYFDSLNN